MIRLEYLRRFRRIFEISHSPTQCSFSSQRRKPKTSLKNSELLNYSKKSPIEHVLLRPGMYVGQTNVGSFKTWTINSNLNEMSNEYISISPALVKLFDEALVNASDNKIKDKTMNEINIEVKNVEHNKFTISILNNGKGIPVAIHPEEKIYIPSLVFGQLLTGSNFEDDKMSRTGGRHGYGAKLANIFSQWFEVETYDSARKLHFFQRWENNMTIVQPPVVTSMSESPNKFKDYIKITFQPELSRFEYFTSPPTTTTTTTAPTASSLPTEAEEVNQSHTTKALTDTIQLMRRRAYDVAGCLKDVTVTFNDEILPVKSFHDYFQMFAAKNISKTSLLKLPSTTVKDTAMEVTSTTTTTTTTSAAATTTPIETDNQIQYSFFHSLNNYCDIGLMVSKTGNFECMSFVNSVWTSKYV